MPYSRNNPIDRLPGTAERMRLRMFKCSSPRCEYVTFIPVVLGQVMTESVTVHECKPVKNAWGYMCPLDRSTLIQGVPE